MRLKTAASLLALAACLATTGCSYKGAMTYGPTRKLLESDAPGATKVGMAPFLLITDSVLAPVTAYIDAGQGVGRKESASGHVYWSFIGARTLINSDIDDPLKIPGVLFTFPVDLVWFPISGVADTAYVLSR